MFAIDTAGRVGEGLVFAQLGTTPHQVQQIVYQVVEAGDVLEPRSWTSDPRNRLPR
jgi:hypothetical protein